MYQALSPPFKGPGDEGNRVRYIFVPQSSTHTGPPQPHNSPPSQTQAYAPGSPQPHLNIAAPQLQQKQAHAVDIPKTFTTDMSKELLALWLSHHQKLVGDYDDDVNILKGITVLILIIAYTTSLIRLRMVYFRSKNKWPQLLKFDRSRAETP